MILVKALHGATCVIVVRLASALTRLLAWVGLPTWVVFFAAAVSALAAALTLPGTSLPAAADQAPLCVAFSSEALLLPPATLLALALALAVGFVIAPRDVVELLHHSWLDLTGNLSQYAHLHWWALLQGQRSPNQPTPSQSTDLDLTASTDFEDAGVFALDLAELT